MAKTALVPIANGSEELEAVTIIDVLRRGEVDVTVASVGPLQIKASRQVNLVADCPISECTGKQFDCIALPGGMPGAEYLRDSAELITMLKEQKDAGRFYAAICASPAVVLAAHGLLDEKKATCYPSAAGQLPDQSEAPKTVVIDSNCITSQGPATAIEFALELVKLLHGQPKADEVAAGMLIK